MEPMVEQFGRFRLIEKIATGAMGEIFLANFSDAPADLPPFVVKRILPHISNEPHFIEMFEKEAKNAAMLHHEAIVKIREYGQEEGRAFIAMEHVDGRSLETLYPALLKKPLTEKKALAFGIEVVLQALNAIAHAHEKRDEKRRSLNIVHFDLSPKNIMIDEEGRVKLLDFGVSRAIYDGDPKALGALIGTMAYMSPEQCREQEADLRSDLFSLGVLLYELTTQTPLFRELPGEFATMKAITEGVIPPPSNTMQDYPEALEEIIFKALHPEAKHRFESAYAFLVALQLIRQSLELPTGREAILPVVRLLESNEKKREAPPFEEPSDTESQDAATDDKVASASSEKRAKATKSGRIKWAFALFFAALLLMAGSFAFLLEKRGYFLPQRTGSVVYQPEAGALYIDSMPKGASISIDGKPIGQAPVEMKKLPLGESLHIQAFLKGHMAQERAITLTDDRPLDALFFRMEKKR